MVESESFVYVNRKGQCMVRSIAKNKAHPIKVLIKLFEANISNIKIDSLSIAEREQLAFFVKQVKGMVNL